MSRTRVVRVTLYYAALVGATVFLLWLVPAFGGHLSLDRLVSSGASSAEQATQFLGSKAARAAAGVAPVTTLEAIVDILGALLLSIPVAWIYMLTKEDRKYDDSVVHTMIILPLVVSGIVLIVRDSIALAFSLAGVVAAVRFRNTLKDTKDAVYIFLAVAIGLSAGVQALVVAFILSLIFNVVVLALWKLDAAAVLRRSLEPAPEAVTPAPVSGPVFRTRGSMMINTKELLAQISGAAHEPVINPELSWLEFNGRVLALAEDPTTPLLARLRFLSIFTTNLDEFFMIKVGGLKLAVAAGVTKNSIDGRTPRELLQAIISAYARCSSGNTVASRSCATPSCAATGCRSGNGAS
jgi:hypothetical protein